MTQIEVNDMITLPLSKGNCMVTKVRTGYSRVIFFSERLIFFQKAKSDGVAPLKTKEIRAEMGNDFSMKDHDAKLE